MDAVRLQAMLDQVWPGCWLAVHRSAGVVFEWPELRVIVGSDAATADPWPGYRQVALPDGKSEVWYKARLMGVVRSASYERQLLTSCRQST